MNRNAIATLSRSRQVALTTVARDDRQYCDRLQTSLVRGSHELLYWGAGPALFRGDIVALYTPKSKYLPASEHSCVRRLYFVAADSVPGSVWNQDVFLHRRVNLDPPLRHRELTKGLGLSFRDIINAGTLTKPMAPDVSIRFLAAASKRCAGGLAALRKLARESKANPKVCISYSGQDWTQAHRLKLWLEEAGLAPFFVSPVGEVLPNEEGPLTNFLNDTFSNAHLVLSLVPPRGGLTKWIELELNAAVRHAKRVIFVRTDAKRPRPPLPSGSNVRHCTLRPARERELVARVKKELAANA